MKKILLVTLTIALCATWSLAADFAPTPLVLTVPDEPIIYPFDGTDVDISFDLSGQSAALWLIVETKLSENEKPVALTNGHLGWHYVNKIDTTVYISGRNARDPGTGLVISWDGKAGGSYGKNERGVDVVSPGQYTYYLWGYDDKSARERVSDFAQTGFLWYTQCTHIYTVGDDGLPLANPLLMGGLHYSYRSDEPWDLKGNINKWEIGSDPSDVTKIEYSHVPEYQTSVQGDLNHSTGFFAPTDYGIWYGGETAFNARLSTAVRFDWVSDGNAIKHTDWGTWDNISWVSMGCTGGHMPESLYTDGDYIYVGSPGRNPVPDNIQWDMLRCLTFEGDEVYNKMMEIFYMPDDNNLSAWPNSEMDRLDPHPDGGNVWYIGSYQFCGFYVMDLTRLLVDEEDETDMILMGNENGDYFIDNNWNDDSLQPWACGFGGNRNEYDSRHEITTFDSNGFLTTSLSYHGLDSFCVMAPDGTGIAYMAFADDTLSDNVTQKPGGYVSDGGNAYDGLYFCDAIPAGDISYKELMHTNWVGFDTVKGVIADEIVAVEDEEVAKFSVDQNSPNPFNPTTTVGFNLVEDGNVNIDIFNIAGQKIDTLVNDFMTAGKHSVVWDASGFSAGVYFYTIKSGDFSKTMKMTLLK